MKFKRIYELVNCEGTILAVVEDLKGENHLYIQGLCLNHGTSIYAKVNDIQLGLYLRGRITLRELFSLRGDEGYILKNRNGYDTVYIYDVDSSLILNTIACGKDLYPDISKDMKSSTPVDEILNRICSIRISGYGKVVGFHLTEELYLKKLSK